MAITPIHLRYYNMRHILLHFAWGLTPISNALIFKR